MFDPEDYEPGHESERTDGKGWAGERTGSGKEPKSVFLRMQQEGGEEAPPAQSEDYMNFIVKYNPNVLGPADFPSGERFQVINDLYAVIYEPLERNPDFEISSYSYNSIPKCYTCMDAEAVSASGAARLHDHPYLKLRGRGTAVAIIDSGIDYRNPLFRDGNGSRILCIWDQTIPGGASELASFGRVFTKAEIDAALESENPLEAVPSVDVGGHGTMLAGAAAGNTVSEDGFSGAAPEAMLIVVRLKPAKKYLREFYLLPQDAEVFQEDDIMMAVSFAIRCAQMHGVPLSVCLGVGTNQGAHQGCSPLSQYLAFAAGFSQNAFSIAAGNEGAARHHYQGVFNESEPENIVDLRVGEDTYGFTMEFWGYPPEVYTVSLQSPTGEELEVSTSLRSGTQNLSFVFVETRVQVNYVLMERYSGNTLIYFRFRNPAPGIWRLKISGRDRKNSRYHIWLPARGMISPETYFLESSPYNTVTSPGDAAEAMTAAAYRHRDDSLYLESSRGFTPNGAVKPNFAAPGVDIRVPLPGGGYGEASGSSLAAAQAAGITALLFEWAIVRGNEPYFSGISVKNFLQRSARREENLTYPNREWGYGRLDLYRAFELLT